MHALTQPSQSFPLTARAAALAGCGAVGKVCKFAFSYGTESDPEVAARFLAKLTRTATHTHVAPPSSSYKTAFVPMPQKAITDTFTGMPKKSAPRRDGWTWKPFRDAASRPSTAALLRKFVELLVNGSLPKGLWKFLSSAIMIPFHKLAQLERYLLLDPRLHPITIGSLLTRFSSRSLLRLNSSGLAKRMLRSNHGIPGGVQQVIMGCIVALECNPTFILGSLGFPWIPWILGSPHTDCSRGLIWEMLMNDTYFHFLIHIFLCMYGDTCNPHWHYGSGPDQPPTSIHWSGDGLCQGETAANVFFNILTARLYMAFMKILSGRGILLAIADDVKICAPPSVLAEIVGSCRHSRCLRRG